MKKNTIYIFLFLFLTYDPIIFAKTLSNKAIFYRCFMKITQKFPGRKSVHLQAVINGADPVEVCNGILNDVNDKGNNNKLSVSVLNTMHKLHFSWFLNKTYIGINDGNIENNATYLDTSSPALFFTKSLFNNQFKYNDIFKNELTLRAERVEDDPIVSVHDKRYRKDNGVITSNTKFAGKGDLLKISILPVDSTLSYSFNPQKDNSAVQKIGNTIYNKSAGGGILGNQVYLLQNSSANDFNYKTDGTNRVNRKWSVSVFKDLLCRDMPAIRETDGITFVDNSSSMAYRTTVGCVKCHVSMDRMASLTRNIYYNKIGRFYNKNQIAPILLRETDMPAKSIFPLKRDKDYYRRPATGSFAFRTHDGKFIDIEVSSVNDLGKEMTKIDDAYICTAKRYYEYFTGISAEIGDIEDPQHSKYKSMSAQDKKYRYIVIQLGKKLKSHQNIKLLVKDIMNSNEFKQLDYGLGEKE